jgi:ATP-dependent Lhr-like helicase
MGLAAQFLRSDNPNLVDLIEAGSGGQELKILVKGYVEKPARADGQPEIDDPEMEDLALGVP